MPTSQQDRRHGWVLTATRLPLAGSSWQFADAGIATMCGESFGTGSNHIRKGWAWAVLFWLNILAVRQQPVEQIVARTLANLRTQLLPRHDYEGVDTDRANKLMEQLRSTVPDLKGGNLATIRLSMAMTLATPTLWTAASARSKAFGLDLPMAPALSSVFRYWHPRRDSKSLSEL